MDSFENEYWLGNFDLAIDHATRAIRLSPHKAIPYVFRGDAKLARGDLRGGARQDYEKALDRAGKDWPYRQGTEAKLAAVLGSEANMKIPESEEVDDEHR